MAVDDQGNTYVTGWSLDTITSYNFATVKYDSNGAQPWATLYDGLGGSIDQAYDIELDGLGNFIYVGGRSLGIGTGYDYAVIKYDSLGNEVWVSRYDCPSSGIDRLADIKVYEGVNPGLYVTGRSQGPDTSYDYATLKYDLDGNQLWEARYNGPASNIDQASDIHIDTALTEIYVTGRSQGTGTGYDYATVKYDSLGNQLWVARYDGPVSDNDMATAIALGIPGGLPAQVDPHVYVTGRSTGPGHFDYATIMYDPLGNEQWMARYNGPANWDDTAISIAVDGQGDAYVTGWSTGQTTSYDYATLKDDTLGREVWPTRYEGPSIILAESLTVAVINEDQDIDAVTIRDRRGADPSLAPLVTGDGPDQALGLAINPQGAIVVTGLSQGQGTSTDYATVLYLQEPEIVTFPSSYNETLNSNETVTKTLTISNIGDAILSWTISESPPVDWLSPAPNSGNVSPGGSQTVNIVFDFQGLQAGTYITTLDVASNDPNNSLIPIPVTVEVVAPDIGVDPALMNETLNPGQTATQTLTINNTGNATLNWDLVENPPAGWLFEAIGVLLTGSVPPGGSQLVNVSFNSTGLIPGIYNANLDITSNDPDTPNVQVSVTLNVVAPNIVVNPTFVQQTLNPDAVAVSVLEISNTGDADLDWATVEVPPVGWLGVAPAAGLLVPGGLQLVNMKSTPRAWLRGSTPQPWRPPVTTPTSLW